MSKITTTTKQFREGVKLSGATCDQIHWESTGHLSVRLLDAYGTHPIAQRKLRVSIPGEGTVELETDDDGKVFHPDVPFQDYELDLGERVKVHAPAVSNKTDVQERHVPAISNAYVRLLVRDRDGFPILGSLTIESPDGTTIEVETDDTGYVEHDGVLPPGAYKIKGVVGEAEIELTEHGDGLIAAFLEEGV
jgi:hypothetical protein